LLLITGGLGIREGITERSNGGTALQKSVTIGVVLYGVLALVSAYGLFRRRAWSVGTAIAWGLVITYVPAAAIIGYGGEPTPVGSVLAASGVVALLALGVIWTAHQVTRDKPEIASAAR
jgi:hypothetical protein